MQFKWLMMTWLLGTCAALAQQTPAPSIFFTDMTSGPASGNSDATYGATGGAYISIYGNNFGTSRGRSFVSLNGSQCLTVVSWGTTWLWYQKIVVKLGTKCTSGQFVVTVGGRTSTCEDVGNQGQNCQFNVRSGKIHYVSTGGNDKNAGTFSAPWATILKARDAMAPGDITYAENGICQCRDDGSGWNGYFTIDSQQGTAGHPLALVVYPGATATIGTTTIANLESIKAKGNSGSACRSSKPVGCQSHWVFAGWTLRSHDQTMGSWGDTDWRLVGNDVSCPNGGGQDACMETTMLTYSSFLGNKIHDSGNSRSQSQYHGLYPSTDSNHLELGWNSVYNIKGCRGIHVHSSPLCIPGCGRSDLTGFNQYDISIHDNLVHDTQCDGIITATVDPSKGAILIYNNVIYNAGLGPYDDGGGWFCINVPGSTNNGTPGSGTVEIYNNTMYNCGPYATPPYNSVGGIDNGGRNANINLHVRNNIIYNLNNTHCEGQDPCAIYFKNESSNPSGVFGDNNLVYGVGKPPSSKVITGTVYAAPQFVNTSITGCPDSCPTDLHLSSASSPANGAGNAGTPKSGYDRDGLTRPSPPAIGAYEFAAGVGGSNPPSNLPAVVHRE